MKSYTDRHWASPNENTAEKCACTIFRLCFLFDVAKATDEIDRQVYEYRGSMPICISSSTQGESQWRNRPKVYEYRGSMPICISIRTQGESQWGHRPSGLWVHGSMPICIVVAHKAKATDEIDRQVYEYRWLDAYLYSRGKQGESQWGHRPSGLWVHGSMPWVSLWKKWKICRIIKKT